MWTQIRPNKTSGLIGVQTVGHSDGIAKQEYLKTSILSKESTGDNKSSMERAQYHYAIAPPVSRSGSFAAFHFKEDSYESCKDTKEAPSYRLKNEFILQYQNNGSFSCRLARIDLT